MIRTLQMGLVCFGLMITVISGVMILQRRTPPPEPMILYSGFKPNHQWWLYIMNADGTNQQRLDVYADIDLPDWELTSPQWSPDRKWVAFAATDGIYRVRLSDGRLDNLAPHDLNTGKPIWSPDGRWIAYTSKVYTTLFRMRPDGSRHELITDDIETFIDYRWSPNGEWIAFIRHTQSGMYRIRPDGTDMTIISDIEGIRSLAWSPDGQWIAFNKGSELYKIRADGTDIQQLSNYVALSLEWSPDGEWIVFSSDLDGDRQTDIYRIRPNGTQLEQLTDTEGHETAPRYSPIIDKPITSGGLLALGFFLIIGPIGLRLWQPPFKP